MRTPDAQFEALKSGKADARFISGAGERYKEVGLHVLPLGPLPMINGPDANDFLHGLAQEKGLGERFVKAIVLGIHFAKTKKERTEKFFRSSTRRRVSLSSIEISSACPKNPTLIRRES